MKKLKVAVVGYGHLGKWHAQKAEAFPEMSELSYIVEKFPTNQQAAKAAHPKVSVVEDISQCIDDIDAAIVVTPTSFHFEIVEYLLKKNKHVFCEKPVTETTTQALKLLELSKGKNLIVQVGHSERFHQAWERKLQLEKFIKAPAHINLKRVAPFKGRATDVDVVQDLMIHDLDLLVYLLGEAPSSVNSIGFKMRTSRYDFVSSNFSFKSGHKATITVGRNQTKEVRELEISNCNGTLLVDLMRNEIHEASGSNNGPQFVETTAYPKRDHLLLEHQHFYDSILNHKNPIVSLEDGLLAVRLIDKVLESVSSGRRGFSAMNSCLIITGEKSGEEHALSFFSELKSICPNTNFFGVGGDELASQGLELLYHLNQFSSWGYSEVIAKIPFYLNAMERILEEVDKRQCKVAILVDYQSFNLKLAGKLKKRGVEVLYYVAPQAWAWKEYRVKKLSKSVHTLFTIIPFEKKWFKERGLRNVISIDHPLWTSYKDQLAHFHSKNFILPVNLLLLPGSRNSEVQHMLPEFIEAVKILKKEIRLNVSIVKSSSVSAGLFENYDSFFDKVYSNDELTVALRQADFAFASSGTVTLTCALFEVPTIVCYKVSLFNKFIFDTFVKYRSFISLANIVHNCSVFPELLQDEVSAYNIVSHFKIWYYNHKKYQELKEKLAKTRDVVRGESIHIPTYLGNVIKQTYGKSSNSTY